MHLNNFKKYLSTSEFPPSLGIQAKLFVESFYGVLSPRPLLRSHLGLTSERRKNSFPRSVTGLWYYRKLSSSYKMRVINRYPKTVYPRHLLPPCSKVTFFVHQGFLTNSLCVIFIYTLFPTFCKMGNLK